MLFEFEIALSKEEKDKNKSVLEEKLVEANKTLESLNQVNEQEHTER